jgi:hypothetical protein
MFLRVIGRTPKQHRKYSHKMDGSKQVRPQILLQMFTAPLGKGIACMMCLYISDLYFVPFNTYCASLTYGG